MAALTKDEILDWVIFSSIPMFTGCDVYEPRVTDRDAFDRELDYFEGVGCDREVLFTAIALGQATDPSRSVEDSDGKKIGHRDIEEARDSLLNTAKQLSRLEGTPLLNALNRRFIAHEREAGRVAPQDAECWEQRWPFLVALPELMKKRAEMLSEWLDAIGTANMVRARQIRHLYPILYIRYATQRGHYERAAVLLKSAGLGSFDSAQLAREVLQFEKNFPLTLQMLEHQFQLVARREITYPVRTDHERTRREIAVLVEEGILSDDSEWNPKEPLP